MLYIRWEPLRRKYSGAPRQFFNLIEAEILGILMLILEPLEGSENTQKWPTKSSAFSMKFENRPVPLKASSRGAAT